jgi:glycine betaine/proline transport system permease protein
MAEHLLADAWQVPRIPLGDWFTAVVDWLNNNVGPLFDAIETIVNGAVNGLSAALLWPPSWVMFLVFALLAWWARSWKFGLISLIGFALADSIGAFDDAMQTLAQVLVSGVIATVIAVPLGIFAARSTAGSRVLRPILDFMQTLPAFVYLIPAIILFSIGAVPGVVATVVFSLPPGVRLTELGIRQVDKEMVEAGESFGAPPRKILTGVQIPLAMPSIMAGINQIIMLSLSMVVIAGMVGSPGLGSKVFESVTRLQTGAGFEYGLGVVILAVYLDRITSSFSGRRTRRQERQFPVGV